MLRFLLLLVILCVPLGMSQEQVMVTISQGPVIGSLSNSGSYYEFLGIPYADNTAGENRFKAPRSPPPFEEVFYANRADVSCPRLVDSNYEGTEDCLVANVFTPNVTEVELLPVLVWIKGNELSPDINGVNLSPRFFVEKDLVVVSLSFRQSIFGFLCLGTNEAPGNAGLKDIVAGLHWINENIEQFGGNPNSITLLGHGDGGAYVDLISLSPMASGLFHRVIMQSGNALSPWAIDTQPFSSAISVAERLGHTVNDPQNLGETFQIVSASILLRAVSEINLSENSLLFGPCIENQELGSGFLLKSPGQILREGEFHAVPVILGFVENEGTIRIAEALENGWLERMNDSFSDFLPSDLSFDSETERESAANQLRTFYFQDREIDMSSIDYFVQYNGDSLVLVSTLRAASIRSMVSTAPLYLYQFSYEGLLGRALSGSLSMAGATHNEDLAYLFDIDEIMQPSISDNIVRGIMIDRWTNFAKTDNPNTDFSAIVWQPYTIEYPGYLHILNDETSEVQITNLEVLLFNPQPETTIFWNELYNSYWKDNANFWENYGRDEIDDVVIPDGEEEEDVQDIFLDVVQVVDFPRDDDDENEVIDQENSNPNELEVEVEDQIEVASSATKWMSVIAITGLAAFVQLLMLVNF